MKVERKYMLSVYASSRHRLGSAGWVVFVELAEVLGVGSTVAEAIADARAEYVFTRTAGYEWWK